MSAGPTTERVYETLRERIAGREFRPGDRLDPAALAEGLASSVTPVRDALYILVGAGLVETRTSGGFFLPLLDEPGLKDLYEWSEQLLILAVRGWSRIAEEGAFEFREDAGLSPADNTQQLFLAIARRSGNVEHARAMVRLNLRLHAVRTVEPLVLDDDEAWEIWRTAMATGTKPDVISLIRRYHRRRRRAAAAILRSLYRTD